MNKTFRVLTLLLLVVMYFTPFYYSQVQTPKQKLGAEPAQQKIKFIQLEKLKAKKKRLEAEIRQLQAQIKVYRKIINKIVQNLQELTAALGEVRKAMVKEAKELAVLKAREKAVKNMIRDHSGNPIYTQKVAALKKELMEIMKRIEIQRRKIKKLTQMSVRLREKLKTKQKRRSTCQKIIIKLFVQLKIKRLELEKVIAEINKLEGKQRPNKSLKRKKE